MSTLPVPVRVRFAPSPTGHLHIGSLRTALFNWLFARQHGGVYLLRIEDTDVERSLPAYVDSILSSLAWSGLMPDEPVVFQMARQAEHRKRVHELIEKGAAYRCFCQPMDAEERIRNLEMGIGAKYDRTCRERRVAPADLEKPHAIRFKLPHNMGMITFKDVIRGDISVDYDQLDDFVIVRRDGVPTYNFVVVADDIDMRITHIIRGEDHIGNTLKQILLYEALGAQPPIFAHLPMILGPSGNRLSKRDGAVSVTEYKEQGFLPDALLNYLARLGWAHGDQEVFTRDELIRLFSLEAVNKKGAVFDSKKLQWLNGVYLRNASAEELYAHVVQLGGNHHQELTAQWPLEQCYALINLYKERATSLLTMVQDVIALAHAPKTLDIRLIAKWQNEKTRALMEDFLKTYETRDHYRNHEEILNDARAVCERNGVTLVMLAQPLRLAITGSITSPGIFDIIYILSKKMTTERIRALIHLLK